MDSHHTQTLRSLLNPFFNIIRHVLKSRKRRSEVFHRLLLGLSVCDLFASTSFFFGTWPIPVGTAGVFMASGNKATCDAQGFFQQFFGVAPPLYNGSLAVYYFLVIRYGWKNDNPQLKIAEKLLHAVPLLYATITAVIGSALDMYRSSNLWCWVSGKYQVTRMVFLYGPVWFSFLVTSFCMTTIYWEVRKQEAKTKKYNSSITSSGRNDLPQRTDHSRRFANQAMFYVLSFWITWLFPTCTRVSQFITGGSSSFVFIALFTIFIPLQGFFNVLVYLRPRYLKFKKKYASKNFCQLLFLGCGCCGGDDSTTRQSIFHVSGNSSFGEFSRFNRKSTVSNIEDNDRNRESVVFEVEEPIEEEPGEEECNDEEPNEDTNKLNI